MITKKMIEKNQKRVLTRIRTSIRKIKNRNDFEIYSACNHLFWNIGKALKVDLSTHPDPELDYTKAAMNLSLKLFVSAWELERRFKEFEGYFSE